MGGECDENLGWHCLVVDSNVRPTTAWMTVFVEACLKQEVFQTAPLKAANRESCQLVIVRARASKIVLFELTHLSCINRIRLGICSVISFVMIKICLHIFRWKFRIELKSRLD